jgi:hypothetical protein
MNTFAVFDDGTSSEILIGDFLDPSDDTPLKAIPINMPDKTVIHSAQNGFWAAFHILKSLGFIKENICFTYQFKESVDTPIVGNSAGLGFCLKLAQTIHLRMSGQYLGFSIAATGVLTDGMARAEIEGVKGIEAKFKGAMECLKSGDWFFYPVKNEPEISLEMREEALQHGIKLVPMVSVEQAVFSLLGTFPQEADTIELKGVGEPAEGGEVRLAKRVYLGQTISTHIRVGNKGREEVTVRIESGEPEADWIKVASERFSIPGGEHREVEIQIPSAMSFPFLLRHSFKVSFRRETELSLHFHGTDQNPHDDVKKIRVVVRFVNPLLASALVLFILCGYGIHHVLHLPSSIKPPAEEITGLTARVEKSSNASSSSSGLDTPTASAYNEEKAFLIADLEGGRYIEAKSRLQDIQRTYPHHEEMDAIANQLQKPLLATSDLIPSSREPSHAGMMSIPSGGGFQIQFRSEDPCYLYIFQIDSHGSLSQLLPISSVSSPRYRVEPDRIYQFPEGEDFFILDNNTGMETVFIIASRWPSKDLEEMYTLFQAAPPGADKDRTHEDLVRRLKGRKTPCLSVSGGCSYKEHTFWHK